MCKFNPAILITTIFLIICLLESCVSNRKALSQWIGANQNELIEKWGEPDRIEKDGIMSIWIYDRFTDKFPGTTGTRSMASGESGESDYDNATAVRFIIGPGRNIVKYELEN